MENGYVQEGGNNYGAIRLVSCLQPYEIRSDVKQIRCESNGRWSEAPRCSLPPTTPTTPVPTSCGPTPQVENGYIQPGPSNYGAIRQVICWQQYEVRSGFKQIRCERNGRWSEAPRCSLLPTTTTTTTFAPLPTECRGLTPIIVNGYVGNGGRNIGSVRPINCNNGYQRVGKAFFTCLSTGEWERPDTQCVPGMLAMDFVFNLILTICLVSASCGPSPQVENGYIQPGSSNYGAIRQVICWQPYEIRSDIKQIRCQRNGRWSEAPSCSLPPTPPATTFAPLPTECRGQTPNIANGFVGNGGRSIGTTRVITCNNGFQRVGQATVTCQRSGLWEIPNTQCIARK